MRRGFRRFLPIMMTVTTVFSSAGYSYAEEAGGLEEPTTEKCNTIITSFYDSARFCWCCSEHTDHVEWNDCQYRHFR